MSAMTGETWYYEHHPIVSSPSSPFAPAVSGMYEHLMHVTQARSPPRVAAAGGGAGTVHWQQQQHGGGPVVIGHSTDMWSPTGSSTAGSASWYSLSPPGTSYGPPSTGSSYHTAAGGLVQQQQSQSQQKQKQKPQPQQKQSLALLLAFCLFFGSSQPQQEQEQESQQEQEQEPVTQRLRLCLARALPLTFLAFTLTFAVGKRHTAA